MIKPSVDYRQFRFSKLNTPEFPSEVHSEHHLF